MQYIPCNSALLAQKTLFLTQKGTVFQIYKSFGIWEDPPPHVGKNSQIISFFLLESVPKSKGPESTSFSIQVIHDVADILLSLTHRCKL